MNKKLIREWKKVFKSDLPYIIYELKDMTKSPALVILDGDLGAGKTTFTQAFTGDQETLSPTYSILSESRQILHADFYRIEKNEEILQLEIPLYLEDKQYFFIEWGMKFSKRIMRELPENWSSYLLEIKINNNSSAASSTMEVDDQTRNFSLYSLAEE
jgi:tRNA threonylcarbamoyladenosine biosynthesis protein TsaE